MFILYINIYVKDTWKFLTCRKIKNKNNKS